MLLIRNTRYMQNYKLKIQYDGTRYSGWQIQKEQRSVQGTISDAIRQILGEPVTITGAGRTDTGVHAWGQQANFISAREIDIFRFRYSLNSILPNDISVIEMKEAALSFNARFDACGRKYMYFFSQQPSPFFDRYAVYRYKPFDIERLHAYSDELIRTADFSAFAKHAAEQENPVCTVRFVGWRRTGFITAFYIEADRFLHGMVRAIAGTITEAYQRNAPPGELRSILESRDRKNAGISVPAKGLFLFKVQYPKHAVSTE